MIDSEHNFYKNIRSLRNVLLYKHEVGGKKLFSENYRDNDFVYGKKTEVDPEGAGDLLRKWINHKPSEVNKNSHKRAESLRDLKKKPETKNFLVKNKSRCQYRLKPKSYRKDEESLPDIRFGRPVRCSTSVKDLITNSFGRQAFEEKNKAYASGLIKPSALSSNLAKKPDSLSRLFPPKLKKKFVLKKFKAIKSKTDCWRVKF